MTESLHTLVIRATYDWLLEKQWTPYLLIDAQHADTQVPKDYVQNGKMVLNLSPTAVRNFYIEKGYISCEASFSGKPWQIFVPMAAVLGLYAKEGGQGLYVRGEGLFALNEEEPESGDQTPPPTEPIVRGGLRLVK